MVLVRCGLDKRDFICWDIKKYPVDKTLSMFLMDLRLSFQDILHRKMVYSRALHSREHSPVS
jgi:hypothetical protein